MEIATVIGKLLARARSEPQLRTLPSSQRNTTKLRCGQSGSLVSDSKKRISERSDEGATPLAVFSGAGATDKTGSSPKLLDFFWSISSVSNIRYCRTFPVSEGFA